MNKLIKNEYYFYCNQCGNIWKCSTFSHDLLCPSCQEYFLDENIERITKKEYEELNQNKA